MASDVTLVLTDANGNNVPLNNGVQGNFPIGQMSVPETSWMFNNPQPGTWKLEMRSTQVVDFSNYPFGKTEDDVPAGYVLVWNDSPLMIYSHLTTYQMEVGQEIGIVSMVLDNRISGNHSRLRLGVVKDIVSEAVMEVTLPDGSEEDVQMHDDGLHGDGEANDGIYGGILVASEPGVYKAEPFLEGTTTSGLPFTRTSSHLLSAVPDYVDLTGTANGQIVNKKYISLNLEVDPQSTTTSTLRAYSEVYGIDKVSGNTIPVCWVSSLVDVQSNNGNSFVSLQLDLDWLALANAQPPLTLKNVIIQESNTFVPVALADEISVTMDAYSFKTAASYNKKVVAITKEMKQGLPPAGFFNKTGVEGAIIILHGYCSTENPWSPYPEDLTNPYFFLISEEGVSVTNDQFSQSVLTFAQENGISSYSLVGHSQGGMVSAHISNYYFSGLDTLTSNGGRKIQSLGTPYEGCSAAGSAANLGKAFGIGCGENIDLSTDGARLWLSGISTDAKSDVHYYTTSYKLGNLFGDYCNLAINMVLEWPNDGTSELVYTNLDGANDQGNTQKQCHTTGMAYSAQYYDHNRNKQMNALAAR